MKIRFKMLTSIVALLAVIGSAVGCADPGVPAGSSDAISATEPSPTVPAGPTEEDRCAYRGDLNWAGIGDWQSDFIATVTGQSPLSPEGLDWWKERRMAIAVQYSLQSKSFWDFTDSEDDLAFYDAEVAYFESLGIEVLKDHCCSVSTPGKTGGIVPALCIAVTAEQYRSIVPRLTGERYDLLYAEYAQVAPKDVPDRYRFTSVDEEWQLAEHPYRSELVWTHRSAGDIDGFSYGEVVQWSHRNPFSPSDRLAIRGMILEEGDIDLEGQIAHLRECGIEVWEDLIPDRVTFTSEGVACINLYLSATAGQLRNLTLLTDDCCYVLYGLNYETDLPESLRDSANA